MPRRPLAPPPPPSPQANPNPGLPSHLQHARPALELSQFPQHQAFIQGQPITSDSAAAATDLFNRARGGDPQALATLQQREESSNFTEYNAPASPPAQRDMTWLERQQEGFSGLYHGGVAGLARVAQTLRAPFNREAVVVGTDAEGNAIYETRQAPDSAPVLEDIARRNEAAIPASPAGQIGGTVGSGGAQVLPYLNPLTGAVAGAGDAMLKDKSDVGVATNAALGAIPGAAFAKTAQLGSRLLGPFLGNVAAGGVSGAVPVGLQALESQYVEERPDLAMEEAGMIAPAGGIGAGLGGLIGLASRGRARLPGQMAPEAPAPVVPPPEVRGRGEFEPIEAPLLPEPQARPFVRPPDAPVTPFSDDLADGDFIQSPFGGRFPEPPPRQPQDLTTTVEADPVIFPQKPGLMLQQALPDIEPGAFRATGDGPTIYDSQGLPLGEPGEFRGVGGAEIDPRTGFPMTRPGEFVPSGQRPAVDEAGLPAGQRGEWMPTAERTFVKPSEGYHQFDPDQQIEEGFMRAEPEVPAGFFEINRPKPPPEGFFEARPKAPAPEPSPFQDARPRVPSEGERAGVDTSAETRVGPTALDPVEYPTAYRMEPMAPGERMRRARDDSNPNDPYARTFRESRAEGDDVQPGAVDPLDELEAQEIARFARADKSLPETEVQLSPVEQRAQMATEPLPARTPVKQRPAEATTRVATSPLAHLSDEAQAYVQSLKPGQRDLIRADIEALKRNPDPAGDAANLRMIVEGAAQRANRPARTPARGFAPRENPPDPKAAPLGRGAEGKVGTKADSDLIQGGFRRAGEAPAPAARPDPNAETRTDLPGEGVKFSGGDPAALQEVMRQGVGLAEVAARSAARALDTWATPLVEIVEKTPGGANLGRKARAVLDDSRQLMGKLDSFRTRALESVTGVSPKARHAQAKLAEVDWDGDLGYAYIHDVLNGHAEVEPLVRTYVDNYRKAFLAGGKEAERIGYEIRVGNKTVKFKTDADRQRAARVLTPEMRWYAHRPDHPHSKALIDAIAQRNNMTPEQVRGEFRLVSERGVTKRNMAEDARAIEIFPTHFRTPDGQVVQLLETDPQKIMDAVARRFPSRVAYVKHMGQDAVPPELEEIGRHGGTAAGQDLLRALNGMPVDDVAAGRLADTFVPGTPAALALRASSVPWTAWKGLKLSLAPLANLPETIGKGRAITGARLSEFIKAGFDASFVNRNRGEIVDDLARRGIISRDFVDWFYNPENKSETLDRFARNTTGYLNNAINEFNELIVGRLADGWSKMLQSGAGGAVDRFRLKVLHFSPSEIDSILKGKASKSVYDAVAARAVEWAQGSTSQAAERSRLGNNRAWNVATVGDRFAQMNVNRNFSVFSNIAKTMVDESASFKDKAAAVAFGLNLGAGQVGAAAATLMFKAIIAGAAGVTAAQIVNPEGLRDFLVDAAMYSYLGGPVQATLGAMTDDRRSVAEHLGGTLLPISTAQEIVDMVRGDGTYEGMTALESGAEFLRRGTPASKAVAHAAGLLSLHKDDPELNAATAAFRRWESRYNPGPRIEGGDPEGAEFRRAMRKAAEAMKDGSDPAEAVAAAMRVKGPEAVAQSLRAKRLLTEYRPTGDAAKDVKRMEKYNALSSYLGVKAMAKLEQYDALLTAWANAVSPPKRR